MFCIEKGFVGYFECEEETLPLRYSLSRSLSFSCSCFVFVQQMGTTDVRIDSGLNQYVWSKGIRLVYLYLFLFNNLVLFSYDCVVGCGCGSFFV